MITVNKKLGLKVNPINACAHILIHLFIFVYSFSYTFGILCTEEPKNLKRLCRMMRAWKNYWDVPMGGLLIDTLAYNFIGNWEYRDKSYLYYDWMSRDFFLYLANQDLEQTYWRAAGSNQYIWRKGQFEYKAKRCYNLALEAISYESNSMNWSARQKWREIYGTAYPS